MLLIHGPPFIGAELYVREYAFGGGGARFRGRTHINDDDLATLVKR